MYQCIRWWFDFGWRDAQGRMNGKLKGREGACVRQTFFSPIELNDLACRFAAAASLVNRWTLVFGDLYSFFRCFVPCDVAATSHLCLVVSATCPLCGGNISCSSSKTTHDIQKRKMYAMQAMHMFWKIPPFLAIIANLFRDQWPWAQLRAVRWWWGEVTSCLFSLALHLKEQLPVGMEILVNTTRTTCLYYGYVTANAAAKSFFAGTHARSTFN